MGNTYGFGGKPSRPLSGANSSVGSGSNGRSPAAAVEAKAIHTSSVYIVEDEKPPNQKGSEKNQLRAKRKNKTNIKL